MSAVLDVALLVLSPTNLLALVALGLLAGREEASIMSGILFAVGLLFGSVAIASALRNTPGAIAQLVVAAATGLVIATAWETPRFIVGLVSFAGGEALTLNTPPQAITLSGAVASQSGAAAAAIVAFGLVAWIASLGYARWHRVAIRIAGSWIAASAILALALRLAR